MKSYKIYTFVNETCGKQTPITNPNAILKMAVITILKVSFDCFNPPQHLQIGRNQMRNYMKHLLYCYDV